MKFKTKQMYDKMKAEGYKPISGGGSFELPESWILGASPEVKILGEEPVEFPGTTANGYKFSLVLVKVEDTTTKEQASVRVPYGYESLVVGSIHTISLQASKSGERVFAALVEPDAVPA